jgi:two-component system phosphate regulon sensor histidine kinase PhoR
MAGKPVRSVPPRLVAFYTALIIGLLMGGISLLLLLLYPTDLSPWWALLLALLTFLLGRSIVGYAIEHFIHARIRLIHRTVHELRSTRGAMMSGNPKDEDVLESVSEEVEAWAREKRSEISDLREREKFRREFIGNLAHELKTPIFNIQGYILTLLEGGLEDEKVNRDFLNRASNGVDRMIKIVEDLDMITKLESGVLELKEERTDLVDLVEEALEAVEMKASERGVEVSHELERPMLVMADKTRMVQAVINLLTNAINYGREGGHCTVKAFEMDDQVVVEVTDDGIGISREHLPRLFERFYRVGKSRSRNEGGSGLGLAIVKHIVDAHGQTITVSSTEGEGTTFTFTLRKAR